MIFSKLLDWVFPHHCPACNEILSDGPGLCILCWEKFDFLDPSLVCQTCGHPLDDMLYESPYAPGCYICATSSIDFARACFSYNDISKKAILKFKHGDGIYLTPFLGNFLYQTYLNAPYPKIDGVVPIPLHWMRLLKRQYNQAGLLAQFFCKKTKISYQPSLLTRCKPTHPQGHLSSALRKKNMKNAFFVPRKSDACNKNILLIDDVWASGATLSEACRTLKAAGAKSVCVLTLARTVIPSNDSLD